MAWARLWPSTLPCRANAHVACLCPLRPSDKTFTAPMQHQLPCMKTDREAKLAKLCMDYMDTAEALPCRGKLAMLSLLIRPSCRQRRLQQRPHHIPCLPAGAGVPVVPVVPWGPCSPPRATSSARSCRTPMAASCSSAPRGRACAGLPLPLTLQPELPDVLHSPPTPPAPHRTHASR